MADIYDGKVFGIFAPLKVKETARHIDVVGGTFRLRVSKRTGQIVSARALGTEFIARGSAMPNPYIALFPPDEPGASPLGGPKRPRYGHEISAGIRPRLWASGLTGGRRYDVRTAEVCEVLFCEPDRVVIRSRGRYGETPVTWAVEYRIDVDGFTKVTVRAEAREPVMLRWHCFNHVTLDPEACDFIVPWTDMSMAQVVGNRHEETRPLAHHKEDELVFGSHVNPFFHVGNSATGIDFSKEDFRDRWAGYKDSGTVLEDGTRVSFDSVLTRKGEELRPADSRGWRRHLTQLYRRKAGYELEDFDIRNTTIPVNPGDPRVRDFWFQLTPPKQPRRELNSTRAVWPGPHQMNMVRWSGRTRDWAPPTDEQVRIWAEMGVNLIVGGINYFSGDYLHPTHPDAVDHFLAEAHKYGLKVIPYVTFSDFNFCAPGYQEHGLAWMTSTGIEYKNETTLMCWGAEGWREHFEQQVDGLLARFPFDGLYIDHWGNTRMCTNERHGCGGYFVRAVTEGYHDIALRARRAVAKHTQGKGIMLVNTGEELFSGMLSMFDLRLMGENFDPRRAPELTLTSTYNAERQGLQILVYPSRYGADQSFLNFAMSFTLPHRIAPSPQSIDDGQDKPLGKAWDGYKPYWDALRFFDVNQATKVSPFASRDLVKLATPGARANVFTRDGKVLLIVGIVPVRPLELFSEEIDQLSEGIRKAMAKAHVGGFAGEILTHLRPFMKPRALAGPRAKRSLRARLVEDVVRLPDPKALGLDPRGAYEVQDLLAHRPVEMKGKFRIPVRLNTLWPQVLLIEPAEASPRVAHFAGADGIAVRKTRAGLQCTLSATPGSPIALYIDPAAKCVSATTEGFSVEPVRGGLVKVAGRLPENRAVSVSLS